MNKETKMDLSKHSPYETNTPKINSDLLNLIKEKLDKFRSEIRNTRLSSELNLRRFKLAENFKDGQHYFDISHQV